MFGFGGRGGLRVEVFECLGDFFGFEKDALLRETEAGDFPLRRQLEDEARSNAVDLGDLDGIDEMRASLVLMWIVRNGLHGGDYAVHDDFKSSNGVVCITFILG